MKKLSFFIILWVFLISLVYLLYSEESKVIENTKHTAITNSVSIMVEQYGNTAYKSFYSIEELRPYCIMQIDKISDMYGSGWMSPVFIISKLDSNDKNDLLLSVIDYMKDLNDDRKVEVLLSKLNNWCKADKQFNFINKDLGVFQGDILKALDIVTSTKTGISGGNDSSNTKIEDLSKEQMDKAYYESLNMISTLSFIDQLNYYGDVYHELSVICKK